MNNSSDKSPSAYAKLYNYYLKIYDGPFHNGSCIFHKEWTGLRFDLAVKYKWFFEVYYAKKRLEYPKNCIQRGEYSTQLTPKALKDNIKNQIVAKKRTISKWKNKLHAWVEGQKKIEAGQLFSESYTENPKYLKAVQKIKQVQKELEDLVKNHLDEDDHEFQNIYEISRYLFEPK